MSEVYDPISDVLVYISQLGLEDIESLQGRSHGKDEGEFGYSDEELAMLLFVEEAEGLLNIAKERRAESFETRFSLLQSLADLEEEARYDHQVALAISEGRPIPPRSEQRSIIITPNRLSDEPPEEPESDSDSSSASSDDDSYFATSSSTTLDDFDEAGPSLSSHFTPKEDELLSCTICGDVISGLVLTAPCGHSFDTTCMETMFQKATVDETLYPPRCCLMPIPVTDIRQHVDARIMRDFEKKSIEFDTPLGNRVYCCRARCSTFLGASTSTPSSLHCPNEDCVAMTCGSCRREAHLGSDCSSDRESEEHEFARMAADFHDRVGWQRCYSCHHLVEKSDGCYHMTCLCKAQFCYLCAAPWKECDCPQFEIPPELIHL